MKFNNPFENPKPVLYMLGVFLIVFFTMRGCNARADSVGRLELGGTMQVHEEYSTGLALIYSERFFGKWDIGIKLYGSQGCLTRTRGGVATQIDCIDNNGGIFGRRVVTSPGGRFELGIGFAYFLQTSRLIGCNGSFDLMLRWNITDRISLTEHHNSNAGICPWNRGQDVIALGWRF